MVLEDVDSDNEFPQKGDDQSKASASVSKTLNSTSLTPQEEVSQQTRSNSPPCQQDTHTNSEPEPCASVPLEDAETQTGRWTPFIESIKREAEDVALATMEER